MEQFNKTTHYLRHTYNFVYYIIDINGRDKETDINDYTILKMLIFNDFMLEQPNLYKGGETKELYGKIYNMCVDFYNICNDLSYAKNKREIRAKMKFVECIKQFRRISEKVNDFLDTELECNDEIHDLMNVIDFITDIGDGRTQISNYPMDELYDIIQKDMLKFIQLVYIWNNAEFGVEKKAIRKIEDYYLKALYSPYTPIGVKRLKKSMEELYE